MHFSSIFSLYVVRSLFVNIVYVLLTFAFISFIIDFLELMRDFQGKEIILSKMLRIAFYKVPFLTYSFMPFVFLFGSIMTFTKLNNNFEFAAAKASGISVWSVCLPITIFIVAFSVIIILALQPLSAVFLDYNKGMIAKYSGKANQKISFLEKGMWLYDQSINPKDDKILHIMHFSNKNKILSNVTVYYAGENNDFTTRYTAAEALINDGILELKRVTKFAPGMKPEFFGQQNFATTISKAQIQSIVPSPDTIQIWELPEFINKIKQSGFSSLKHELYYSSLLFSPFMYLSLVFIALACSINLPRNGKLGIVFITGGITGVIIFFINKVINVMALTGALPLLLAVAAPSVSYLLLSGAILIHYEEG